MEDDRVFHLQTWNIYNPNPAANKPFSVWQTVCSIYSNYGFKLVTDTKGLLNRLKNSPMRTQN